MDDVDKIERLALEFYAREEDTIKKLCRMLTRRFAREARAQALEEALREAMRVVPMAMATYRAGSAATLRTHILGSIRWYVWKFAKRGFKLKSEMKINYATLGQQHECHADERVEQELLARDEVESILDKLPEAQAELLRWRFVEEMSLDEIGELLGCARSTACSYVRNALDAARQVIRHGDV